MKHSTRTDSTRVVGRQEPSHRFSENAATMRPTGSLANSCRAEVTMDVFDFDAEAELFPSRGKQSRRHPVGYRRFAWQSHAQVAGCFSRLGIIVAAGATATEFDHARIGKKDQDDAVLLGKAFSGCKRRGAPSQRAIKEPRKRDFIQF